MNESQKVIVVAVFLAVISCCGWGWTVRPHLRYELIPQTNYYYCGLSPTPPLAVVVSVDNVGGTTLVTDMTFSVINATISTNQDGPFGSSATAHLLIRPKDSFAWWFYVLPDNHTNSFKVSIPSLRSVYGLDPLSDLIYFIYSTSIYQPLNVQPLTYVGSACNFNLQPG